MTPAPVFSIIAPNFNNARYIAETIDSVRLQSFNSWELIIIDDCSTDNSVDIIRHLIEDEARISLIRMRENLGGAHCRNIGLRKAAGYYVLFLDSDDVLAPYCLAERLNNISKFQGKDFYVFPIDTFVSRIGDCPSPLWNVSRIKNPLRCFLSHDLPWTIMSVIWNRKSLLSLGGFNTLYARLQDVELHTRALLAFGNNFEIFAGCEADAFYRVNPIRHTLPKVYMADRIINSFKLFIIDFSFLVDLENKRFIKGTYASMVIYINTLVLSGQMTFSEASMCLAKINVQLKDVLEIPTVLRLAIRLYFLISTRILIPGSSRILKSILLIS